MLCHITFIIKFWCWKIININYWLMNIYIAILLLCNVGCNAGYYYSTLVLQYYILQMVWFGCCIGVPAVLHNIAVLCYNAVCRNIHGRLLFDCWFLFKICFVIIIRTRCWKIINITYWLMNIHITILLSFNFSSSILHNGMAWLMYMNSLKEYLNQL